MKSPPSRIFPTHSFTWWNLYPFTDILYVPMRNMYDVYSIYKASHITYMYISVSLYTVHCTLYTGYKFCESMRKYLEWGTGFTEENSVKLKSFYPIYGVHCTCELRIRINDRTRALALVQTFIRAEGKRLVCKLSHHFFPVPCPCPYPCSTLLQ